MIDLPVAIMFVIPLIIAVLYSLGGSDYTSKFVRRFGIPFVLSIYYVYAQNWTGVITIWLLFPVLCLGYGEDGWLRKLCLGNNLVTRAIISIIISIILYISTSNILSFLFSPWYVMLTAKWKWDDFEVVGLNFEELMVGLGLGICALWI